MNDRLDSLNRRHLINVVGILLVVAVVAPFLAFAAPQAVGAEQSYIVQSGSMSPAIGTGDVIFVYETDPQAIEEGDIITYNRDSRARTVTTHRVVEVQEGDDGLRFVTKGDANPTTDLSPVPAANVIGEVPQVNGHAVSIPFMGYLLVFMQSQQGIIVFVFIPVGLLIASEILSLYREAKSGQSSDESGSDGSESGPDGDVDGPDGAIDGSVTTDGGASTADGGSVMADTESPAANDPEDSETGDDAESTESANESESSAAQSDTESSEPADTDQSTEETEESTDV